MAGGEKFLFDTSFDAESEEHAKARKNKVEPTFSAADLAKAEQDGFARGRTEGAEDVRSGVEQAARAALERIGEQLPSLFTKVAEDSARHEAEALELALHVVRKLFPALAQSHGLAEIESVLRDCLERRRREPHLVIRTSDAVHELVRGCTEELSQELGFEGKAVFLTEEGLGPSDVRVEWADGGAERDTGALWAEIDGILARFLEVNAPQDDAAPAPSTAEEPPRTEAASDHASAATGKLAEEPHISEDTIVGAHEPPPLKQESFDEQ